MITVSGPWMNLKKTSLKVGTFSHWICVSAAQYGALCFLLVCNYTWVSHFTNLSPDRMFPDILELYMESKRAGWRVTCLPLDYFSGLVYCDLGRTKQLPGGFLSMWVVLICQQPASEVLNVNKIPTMCFLSFESGIESERPVRHVLIFEEPQESGFFSYSL